MRVRPRFVLTIVSWAFFPLSFFCLLGSCVGGMWQTRVIIANETGERISVTPLGRSRDGRRLRPLPLSYTRVLCVPRWDRGGFAVDPGKRRSIIFDWDDVVLSEIAVRGEASGEARQWTAPLRANGTREETLRGDVIRIASLADLDPLDPAVREMALVAETFELRWLLADLFLANIVLAAALALLEAWRQSRAAGTSLRIFLFGPSTQSFKAHSVASNSRAGPPDGPQTPA